MRARRVSQRCAVIAAAIFSVVGIGTAAFAYPPEELATPAMTMQWEQRPTGRDYERNYPEAALNAEQSGVAVLCCTANANGRLDCRTAYESPEGAGFGDGAIGISHAFRMRPEDAAVWSASRAPIRLPVWFFLGLDPGDARIQAAQARVFEATRSICETSAPVS